jgi:hypothetical protein
VTNPQRGTRKEGESNLAAKRRKKHKKISIIKKRKKGEVR